MTDFNEKEYNSVILGAMLHDVGKFLQRAKGKDSAKGKHADISGDFVACKNEFNNNGKFKDINLKSCLEKLEETNEIDINIVEKTARYHSSPHTPQNSNLLELIVNQADSYSSNERRTIVEEQGVGGSKYMPLFSVFNKIDIGKTITENIFSYNAIALSSLDSFPQPDKNRLNDDEVAKLIKYFEEEIKKFNKTSKKNLNFKNFYNTVFAVLEKYLCFLPCDTSIEYPDVSLFDHLKSTSAIAACLYHFHHENNTLENKKENQEKVRDKDLKKILLVGGELSGIQNYIYQISSITGEGGVAKRLRARSFYVSILMEVVTFKILNKLNLPLSCNLMCSGGKFEILAPNTEKTRKILEETYKEISDWLIEELSGELSLNMVYDVEICGKDFHMKEEDEIKETEEYNSNFYKCFKKLETSLKRKRKNKFAESLIKNQIWNEDAFIRVKKYNDYDSPDSSRKNACKSCGKFPVKYPDPHEEKNKNSKEKFCEKCAIDKVIGRKLLDAKYIAIGVDTNGKLENEMNKEFLLDREYFFFFNDKYFIQVLDDFRFDIDYLVVEKIRERETEEEPIKLGMVNRFIGNYVPRLKNDEKNIKELCKKCKKENKYCEHYIYLMKCIRKKVNEPHLYTFECIAAESSDYEFFRSKMCLFGNQMIGVLKADVDNLGRIFSEGLKERLTISRYLTISRMLDLFFSGWLFRILKEKPEFKNIYTIYSGGDDVLLVGPWETIINFSEYLNHEFREFTCKNNNITLSAGISIVNPKKSISLVVDQANENIQKSKTAEDKDSLTIWNTTICWKEFNDLRIFMKNLEKGYLCFPEILSRQFIHRLLKYHKMFLDANDPINKKIEGLMFHSKMNYDVRRNIIERLEKLKLLEIILLSGKNEFIIQELLEDKEMKNKKKLIASLFKLAKDNLIELADKLPELDINSKISIKITKKGKDKILNRQKSEDRKWFNKTIPEDLMKLYKATIDQSYYNETLMKNIKIPIFWTLHKTREITKEDGNGN